MERLFKRPLLVLLAGIVCPLSLFAQNFPTNSDENTGDDRNVMLNASNNRGPRDVNIGLPATFGGTPVMENGMPVVYFFWPQKSTKAWRNDATISRSELYDIGQTAIHIGDVGLSLVTYDNLGTAKFQGHGTLNSNHYGLFRGDINMSGPLNKKGLQFSVGAFVNLDPGTYTPMYVDRYYSDKSQLYKVGLTQRYNADKGLFSVFYKYMNTKDINKTLSPFIYDRDGNVKEIDGFKIGRKSYYERSGMITRRNPFTNEYETFDVVDDFGSISHSLDLAWQNEYDNGLMVKGIVRGHIAETGNYVPIMTGVSSLTNEQETGVYYEYEDGTRFTGDNVQNVLILSSRPAPIKSLTGTFSISKNTKKHDWSIGFNQWLYDVDKFASVGNVYYQEVAPDPRKLIKRGENAPVTDAYGNIPSGFEYHNGTENKTALYVTDKWRLSEVVDLSLGARLEYHSLRGDYQDSDLNAIDLNAPKTAIKKDWLNKAFSMNFVYKITDKFGLLGEAYYIEQSGHLESYTIGKDPDLKQSKIPGGSFGLFYNHPLISLVSKATYIQRDEYRATVNFSTDRLPGLVKREVGYYDIQTIGWSTDIITSPFKNFDLHVLLTLQLPEYKNFSGQVDFGDGIIESFNFSNKTVTGISKVLIEIDPSYVWNDLRVWASARYFSKQYMNKANVLYFKGHWETFAGASYSLTKFLDLNVSVVNLLNHRGASGSIPDADLIQTKESAKSKEGTIMSGTYIRPFTFEFGLKYRF